MRLTVIIPNFNGEKYLGVCLDSLSRQTSRPDAVVVVDNGSSDGSVRLARSHRVRPDLIELETNLGFAFAANRGIGLALEKWGPGSAVALLNNDASADPRWLESGRDALARYPSVSMFACLMLDYFERDLVDSAGDLYPPDGRPASRGRGRRASGFAETAEVISPCGGACFFRSSLFEEVGDFEESFFAYLEDVDLGLRARALGHKCLFLPGAVVYHVGAATELSDKPGPKPVDSALRVRRIAANRVRLVSRNWPGERIKRWSPFLLKGLARGAAYHLFRSGQGAAFMKGLGEGLGLVRKDRDFYGAARASGRAETDREVERLMIVGARPWAR